jgi:hypothetical protein
MSGSVSRLKLKQEALIFKPAIIRTLELTLKENPILNLSSIVMRDQFFDHISYALPIRTFTTSSLPYLLTLHPYTKESESALTLLWAYALEKLYHQIKLTMEFFHSAQYCVLANPNFTFTTHIQNNRKYVRFVFIISLYCLRTIHPKHQLQKLN